MTNAHTGHSISVPVVLRSELDKTKTLSMRSRNGTCPGGYFVTAYPFYCSIRFADPDVEFDIDVVFAVHQEFSLEKGNNSFIICIRLKNLISLSSAFVTVFNLKKLEL